MLAPSPWRHGDRRSSDDGEGELLARIAQAQVGPDLPVIAILDLHATARAQLMADNANALISYRTYPHIDQYERTWQARRAARDRRAMKCEIRADASRSRAARSSIPSMAAERTSPPFKDSAGAVATCTGGLGWRWSSASKPTSPRPTSTISAPPIAVTAE